MNRRIATTLVAAIAAFLLGMAIMRPPTCPERTSPLRISISKQLDTRQYHWIEAETFHLGSGWKVGRLRDLENLHRTDGWIFPYEDYYCTLPPDERTPQSVCVYPISVRNAGPHIVWVRAACRPPGGEDTLVLETAFAKARIAPANAAATDTPTFAWYRAGELAIQEQTPELRMTDPDGVPTLVDCLLITNDQDFVPETKHRNPTRGEQVDSAWIDLGGPTSWLRSVDVECTTPAGTSIKLEWRTRRSLDTASEDDARWAPLRLTDDACVAHPSGPLHRFFQWRGRLGTSDRSMSPSLVGMTLHRVNVSGIGLDVDAFVNGRPARNRYPFRHESTLNTQLKELRQRYGSSSQTSQPNAELERMVCLRDWVKARFATGSPSPYPPWNARVVLDWINSARTGGFCAQYCQVFVQAALALGWNPRYVGVFDKAGGRGHMTVEVWSNQFNRWILMDPTYNVHFERRGIPLNALELHAAWMENTTQTIEIEGGRHHFDTDPYDETKPNELFAYFAHFNIYLRNDHLSVPLTAEEARAEARGRQVYSLNYTDGNTPPQKRFGTHQSSRPEDFYWPINQVYIRAVEAAPKQLRLALTHNMPNFSHYQVTVNGRNRSVPESAVTVVLTQKTTRIEISAVNLLAVVGPPSVLTVSRH